MESLQTKREELLRKHGAPIGLFFSSAAWRDLEIFLILSAPSRRLPSMSPAEIAQLGAVFAANDQGYHDCLGQFASLTDQSSPSADIEATYQDEDRPPPMPKPRTRKG